MTRRRKDASDLGGALLVSNDHAGAIYRISYHH